MDEAMICPKCGCATGAMSFQTTEKKKMTGLQIAAYVFMLINLVTYMIFIPVFAIWSGVWLIYIFYIVPVGITMPPILVFESRMKHGRPVGVGLKVCILLLVSLIAGILLLCDRDGDEKYY